MSSVFRFLAGAGVAILVFVATAMSPGLAQTGEINRISQDQSGAAANSESSTEVHTARHFSLDGRYSVFVSMASNLVANDTNNDDDVFLHDRLTGQIERISVASNGAQGNSASRYPSISADGRFVAFASYANNLVAGDSNGSWDVFVHDRQTKRTKRVSATVSGIEGNNWSLYPAISGNGRYIAFQSDASNLTSGDFNSSTDILVHDRKDRSITRVSLSSSNTEGYGDSEAPAISHDGRFVAFSSTAYDLVPNDNNNSTDIFVRDRVAGTTTRVSVDNNGIEGNSDSNLPSISDDGAIVSFHSYASNLVAGDTNGVYDVFVHNRQSNQTTRISVSASGAQSDNHSFDASVSAGGRYVAFYTEATNLVANDMNAVWDVFIRDLQNGSIHRMSVNDLGAEGDSFSAYPTISNDGTRVMFRSLANNFDGTTIFDWQVFIKNTGLAPDGPAIKVTPPNTPQFIGFSGAGVATPSKRVFTLTNVGDALLKWKVKGNSNWLDFSRTYGVLNPGQSTTIQASVTANSSLLPVGDNQTIVEFMDRQTKDKVRHNIVLKILPLGGVRAD